jgi:hypothetical protein
MLSLFRRGQVTQRQLDELAQRLEADLARQSSVIRQLETEQATLHDQVRKWMRRAVAAESRVDGAPQAAAPIVAAPPPGRLWGARARRLARIAQEEATNGIHT